MIKAMAYIDWESCQNKYGDILELFNEQYPSAEDAEKLGKDYPHSKDDVTKAFVTTKLKAIRLKYRHAVDSGRRSGHGRVVLLYFELCEHIWGGSPATTTIPNGIETSKINDDTLSLGSSAPSPSTAPSPGTSESLESDTQDGGLSTEIQNRRDMLNTMLSTYKQKRLKRKLPNDGQMLVLAQEDLKVKKQILERMESNDKDFSENMGKLTSNIENLTNSMVDGFALMRQMIQPPYAAPPHYAPHNQPSTYPYGHINSGMPGMASTPASSSKDINPTSTAAKYCSVFLYTVPLLGRQRQ